MARNEFLFAWMMVVTLLLMVILAVTAVFVWKSGLLSGQVPLVEATSESGSSPQNIDVTGTEPLLKATDSFNAQIFCLDPSTFLLVPENRTIPGAIHLMGRVMNVLEALRATPLSPSLQPAVPPEIQFRTAFFDRDNRTIYIDLVNVPESWQSADPLQVGACLYAIVHTLSSLGSEFQFTRFLIDGREPEISPGGFLLSEVFSPSEDWIGGQANPSG
ncbi:GerMN domain-containing protein [bacterium]|nr:GerMN domain-containing protein [bacterium]